MISWSQTQKSPKRTKSYNKKTTSFHVLLRSQILASRRPADLLFMMTWNFERLKINRNYKKKTKTKHDKLQWPEILRGWKLTEIVKRRQKQNLMTKCNDLKFREADSAVPVQVGSVRDLIPEVGHDLWEPVEAVICYCF